MPLVLVFAATGFWYLEQYLKARTKGKAALITTVLLVLVTAIQLPRGLVSLHAHRLPEKLAGLWLKENEGSGTTIMTRKPLVAYHADGNYVRLQDGLKLGPITEHGRNSGAGYLAGYPSKLREMVPDFDKEEEMFLSELISFKDEKGEEFIVYRIRQREEPESR
jgi:hypothetical protein